MTEPTTWALGYFEGTGGDDANGDFVGLVVRDRVRDLRADRDQLPGVDTGSPTGTRDLLSDWDSVQPVLDRLSTDAASGTWADLAALTARSPIDPRQVVQAGANYRKHVIDLAVSHADIANGRTEQQVRDETAAMMDQRKASGTPYFFIGLPSAIAGPTDDVVLPAYSQRHDWELELAAVIGAPAFRVDPAHALDHVAAYTIVNDLTTRDLVFRADMREIGTDWYRSKNAPGFLPTGPLLVPARFVGDPQQLHITLALNGDTMQDESASDMLFTVAELVAAASQTTPLLPGDLVLTGSPAGNGAHWGRFLRDGDVMEGSISGLGVQRTRLVAEAIDD